MRGFLLIVMLAMPFYALGDYFSKIYSVRPGVRMFILSMLFYSISSAIWLPALTRLQSLSVAGTTWSVMGVMVAILMGVFLFGEKVSTVQCLGMALGVISIVLLSPR